MDAQPIKPEPAAAVDALWHSLGTPAAELRLEWTLPTGEQARAGRLFECQGAAMPPVAPVNRC